MGIFRILTAYGVCLWRVPIIGKLSDDNRYVPVIGGLRYIYIYIHIYIHTYVVVLGVVYMYIINK